MSSERSDGQAPDRETHRALFRTIARERAAAADYDLARADEWAPDIGGGSYQTGAVDPAPAMGSAYGQHIHFELDQVPGGRVEVTHGRDAVHLAVRAEDEDGQENVGVLADLTAADAREIAAALAEAAEVIDLVDEHDTDTVNETSDH